MDVAGVYRYTSDAWRTVGQYRTNGFISTVWGPPMWALVHTGAHWARLVGIPRTYAEWIGSLRHILPCGACRENVVWNMYRAIDGLSGRGDGPGPDDDPGLVDSVREALVGTRPLPPRRVRRGGGWNNGIERGVLSVCTAANGEGCSLLAHRLHRTVRKSLNGPGLGTRRGCSSDRTYAQAVQRYHVDMHLSVGWSVSVTHWRDVGDRLCGCIGRCGTDCAGSVHIDFPPCTIGGPMVNCRWLCMYVVCMNAPVVNTNDDRIRGYHTWLVTTIDIFMDRTHRDDGTIVRTATSTGLIGWVPRTYPGRGGLVTNLCRFHQKIYMDVCKPGTMDWGPRAFAGLVDRLEHLRARTCTPNTPGAEGECTAPIRSYCRVDTISTETGVSARVPMESCGITCPVATLGTRGGAKDL